jgi:hypothetical protein
MHIKGGKSMRVKIESNVLTVETDIPVSVIERGIVDPTVYDEKKNPVYTVRLNENGKGSLGQLGMMANSIINDKLAVVIVEEIGFTREDFKKKYGRAVIAAQKFCPIITGAAATEEEMLEAAFADAE